MIGAIAGDIIGSRFEFKNHRSKGFDLFHRDCTFTDDTVLTIATMDSLLHKRIGVPHCQLAQTKIYLPCQNVQKLKNPSLCL